MHEYPLYMLVIPFFSFDLMLLPAVIGYKISVLIFKSCREGAGNL